jgi:hypothetical protein
VNFLTSGCSFTGQEKYNNGWPVWLKEFGQVKNLGVPGAGNQYISDSIILEVSANKKQYDCVLVMWSGLQRIDFIVDHLAANKDHQALDDVSYLVNGDSIHELKEYKSIIMTGNELTRGIRSILEIIKLQNFLKNKKIKYYFMSYVNYWNDKDNVKNYNFGVFKYEKLKVLCNEIDFDNFIFAENNDCIFETSKKCNGLYSDDFHPSAVGYDYWMNQYVIPRLKEDKVI